MDGNLIKFLGTEDMCNPTPLINIFSAVVMLAALLGCSESDSRLENRIGPDRVVYRGYFYTGSSIWPPYGRVQTGLVPRPVRNPEENLTEYASPYTLAVNVWTHPDRLRNEYIGKEVVIRSIRNIQVLSMDGELLYEDIGGITVNTTVYVYAWSTERDALTFDAQEISIKYTLALESDGEERLEPVEIFLAAPEYHEVKAQELAPGTP